jgi:hypothetical protein
MLALSSSVTLFYLHRSVKAFTGSYGNVLPYRVSCPRIVNLVCVPVQILCPCVLSH